jgi:hypothetical protein
MRTIETIAYKFEELSEVEQQKATGYLSDINVNYGWWENVYYDAKEVYLLIKGFDTFRKDISISFLYDAEDTAYKIEKEHGETCNTYSITKEYLKKRDELIEDAEKDEFGEFLDCYELDSNLDELDKIYLKQLGEEFFIILDNEYIYLTSEEAVKETILSNDYEFNEFGKLI